MVYKKEYLEAFLKISLSCLMSRWQRHWRKRMHFWMTAAVIADSFKDVKDYFEENGMDTAGLTKEELLEESEVFALPDGKYLIVEG